MFLYHDYPFLSVPLFNLYGESRMIVILPGLDWLQEYEWYHRPKGSIVIFFPSHGTKKCTLTHWNSGLSASSVLRHRQTLAVLSGFGGLRCPGLHFAEASSYLNISISCILAAFTIIKQFDKLGKEITPPAKFEKYGALWHPKPFKFMFIPTNKD